MTTPATDLDTAAQLECAKKERLFLVGIARVVAEDIARQRGEVTIEDVLESLREIWGIKSLGNGSGCVFRGRQWQWTGRRQKSSRPHSRGRRIMIWRLKCD